MNMINKTDPSHSSDEVALIGAGPIGLEIAVALKRAGISYVHFERKQIADTISWMPRHMSFFSSVDRISIAGVPIPLVDRTKCTREEYLAYLRGIVQQFDLRIKIFEPVVSIERLPAAGFLLHTITEGGEQKYFTKKIIFATGDTSHPNMLNIPGEDLPHVSHYFEEAHSYFRRRVLIVGGKNSAVEAALKCYHVGAEKIFLSYRREAFNPGSVKYWLLPELQGLISRGQIIFCSRTVPTAITPTHVMLKKIDDNTSFDVAADAVLLMTGYVADMSLLKNVGVELSQRSLIPTYDEQTMKTNIPGVYVAGTAIAGTQHSYQVFIENCHVHADRIIASLLGKAPPEETPATGELET